MYNTFRIPMKEWQVKFDFFGIDQSGPHPIWFDKQPNSSASAVELR